MIPFGCALAAVCVVGHPCSQLHARQESSKVMEQLLVMGQLHQQQSRLQQQQETTLVGQGPGEVWSSKTQSSMACTKQTEITATIQ